PFKETTSGLVGIRVTDGFGGVAQQTFELDLVFENQAPKFVSQIKGYGVKDVPYQYDSLAIDPDGQSLVYALDYASLHRGMSIDSLTGVITWTPQTTGVFDVTITATDPLGGSATQSYPLTITDDGFPEFDMPTDVYIPVEQTINIEIVVNDLPINDGVFVFLDDPTIGAEIIQFDIDNDNFDEDVVTYQPPVVGVTPIRLIAVDSIGQAVDWIVNVHAYEPNATNQAPKIIDIPTPILYRDQPFTTFATAFDSDYDPLTWTFDASNLPGGGFNVHSTTGQITWTPPASGFYVVTINVDDDDPTSAGDTRTVGFTVLDNAPPKFTSPPILDGVIGVPYVYFPSAEDPNIGDTELLEFSGTIQPSYTDFGNDPSQWPDITYTVDPNTGQVDWTPSEPGNYFVSLVVVDPHGAAASQAYGVKVIDPSVNLPPDLIESPAPRLLLSPKWGENAAVPLDYQAQAIDPNNDHLTFTLHGGPVGMEITPDGRLRWTPIMEDLNSSGTYTITVSDGRGGVHSADFSYSVGLDAATKNRAPDFTSKAVTKAIVTKPYYYNADAVDPDGDYVTYSLDDAPSGMSINEQSGLIQWTPPASALGSHYVTVVASDVAGASNIQRYQLNVVRGDADPQITSPAKKDSRANDYYHYQVTASDADGDDLIYYLDTIVTDPDLPLFLDPITGVLSGYTPTVDTYTVGIVVEDTTGRTDTQTFDLVVGPESTAIDPNNLPAVNNVAPTISTTMETIARVGAEWTYQFDAIDPDVVRGDVLTWTESNDVPTTESTFNFDPVTQSYSWTPSIVGQYNFVLTVTDSSGAFSWQSWSVQVLGANTDPTLDPINDLERAAGEKILVDAVGRDLDGDTLTYSINTAASDRGIKIDDQGRISWQTELADLNSPTQEVVVTVTDGFVQPPPQQTFTITLTPDNTPPEITVTANREKIATDEFVDLQVNAFDNIAVDSKELRFVSLTDPSGNVTAFDQPLALSANGTARFYGEIKLLGTLTFTATAIDSAGLQNTDTVQVSVFDPSDIQLPQVKLISPQSGDSPILPTDIIGSVSDNIVVGLNWTLTVEPVDGGFVRTIATGTGPVTADVLGQFDPTIVRDGSYLITLSATDLGNNTATDAKVIDVKSELKLGNFSLSFTDLEIPVAGIPITVTRTYDTLDAELEGDFGYGWSLDFAMPNLYLQSGSVTKTTDAGYPAYVNGTRMTVVTPDGQVEGFNFSWIPASSAINGIGLTEYYRPSFTADPGNKFQLIPPGGDQLFKRLTVDGPYQDLSGRLYSGQDPYFGGVYQLKEADGRTRQMTYDVLVGPRGTVEMTAHRISDKYGNSLELSSGGITGTRINESGQREVTRGIQIVRDARQRIRQIIDPRGGVLLYNYDSQGRLAQFYDRMATERLLDGIPNNEFSPVQFIYDIDQSIEISPEGLAAGLTLADLQAILDNLPASENYLTKIIDPLGIDALSATFDENGRVRTLSDAESDAEGNALSLDYTIGPDGAEVDSESSVGNPIQSAFDSKGRVIRETNQAGQDTVYWYENDEIRYPFYTVQVVGTEDGPDAWYFRTGDDRVTTRWYHSELEGAVTRETDPDGNTTWTAYSTWNYDKGYPKQSGDDKGNVTNYLWFDAVNSGEEGGALELVQTKDQDGNTTTYSYDQWGNVVAVTQGNSGVGLVGSPTSFTYDTFGDLVATRDADGNLRKINYNENGDQVGTQFAYYPNDEKLPTEEDLQFGNPYGLSAPATRTLITTENDLDWAGNVRSSQTIVQEQEWLGYYLDANSNQVPVEDWDERGYHDVGEPQYRNDGASTEYDALGRAFKTSDDNGRESITVYDKRGLAVENWTESPDADGNSFWQVSRTVYDSEGRAVYSTGSFAPDTPTASITGSYSVYDDGDANTTFLYAYGTTYTETGSGLSIGSEQTLGMDIDVTAVTGSPTIDIVHDGQTITVALMATSALTAPGSVISSSRSFYDDQSRVIETENDYGLRSQTLYDENGRVIESRSEIVDTSGATPVKNWMVSRTLFDDDGKVLASTDRFLVPEGTDLGNDPTGGPVLTQITKTIYDDRGRTIATERYSDGSLSFTGTFDPAGTSYHPGFTLDDGSLESVSETLYDAAGRVYRTISGRVQLASLSTVAQSQDTALASYPIYPSGHVDRYADAALSVGILSDTLFDSRGRQYASLSHPLPAADVGLSGPDYNGKLIRLRRETLFNSYGQTEISRSGLAQVESTAGQVTGIFDVQSVDMESTYDPFGNVVKSAYVTGGTLNFVDKYDNAYNFPLAVGNRGEGVFSQRSQGTTDSFTMTHFDDENRPVAEMQSAPGFITAVYDETTQTFRVASVEADVTGLPYAFLQDSPETELEVNDPLPTKLYNYDADGRLESVELPAVEDPNNNDTPTRPKYEYTYDGRGNQVSIISPPTAATPVGAETRFAFNERGQQWARALPLAFGSDGDASATELSAWMAALEAWSIED
ncbi:MAG: putative Ig domain-containing protein, partial [Planctomycetales bacterium]|nr:putative Ig domain-containing protein [Planctomycetales bacterium]